MSWENRNAQFNKLEKLCEDPDMTLNDILANEHVSIGIRQQLPKLLKFFAKNIQDVIDIAIGRVDAVNENDVSVCNSIISSRSKPITEALTQNFYYVADGIDESLDMRQFFNVMQQITDSTRGNCYKKLSKPESFMKKLISFISNDAAMEYMLNLIIRYGLELKNFFETSHLDQLLIDMTQSGEELGVCATSLLQLRIDLNHMTDTYREEFFNYEKLGFFIDLGLNACLIQLASNSFNIARLIFNSSNPEHVSTLDQMMPKIYNYIISDKGFGPDRNSAFKLFLNRAQNQDVSYTLFIYLFDLYPNHPHNSFLHNAALNLFESLSHNENFAEFIQKSDIHQKIIKIVSLDGQTLASYWGHVQRMAELINATPNYEPTDEWKSLTESRFNPRKIIKENPYGGEAVAAPLEEVPLTKSQLLVKQSIPSQTLFEFLQQFASAIKANDEEEEEEEDSGEEFEEVDEK